MEVNGDYPVISRKVSKLPAHTQKAVIFLAILIVCFSIYSNSFSVPFQFDDVPNITKNDAVRINSLNFEELRPALFSSRPLPVLSFAINFYFCKENPFGYHFVNILIHVITAFFLFLFIYNSLQLPILEDRYKDNVFCISAISVLLWCVNPIQTQAVTYIVQRMASMAAMFYIGSMYFYLKARTSHKGRGWKGVYWSFCLLFMIMAVLSKQNAVMLPITLLLFEATMIRKFSKNQIKPYAKTAILVFIVTMALGAMAFSLSDYNFYSFIERYEIRPFTLTERLLTQPRVILFYISLLLYPSPLRMNISHHIEISNNLFNPLSTMPAILLLLTLILLSCYIIKRWPFIGFCLIFFFLNHLIESSILPLELIFEHRNYLPSMLFFVPFAAIIYKGLFIYKQNAFIKTFIVLLTVGIIGLNGITTYIRNMDWQTKKRLWYDAVIKAPNSSRNHLNFAVELRKEGEIQNAFRHAQIAEKIGYFNNTGEKQELYFLKGNCFLAFNALDEAIKSFEKANEVQAEEDAYNNIAIAYLRKGELGKAKEALFNSIAVEKTAEALNNLGHILLLKNEIELSVNYLNQAIELGPKFVGAYNNLATAYKMKQEYLLAIDCFERSIQINKSQNPLNIGLMNAYLGLIESYQKSGNENAARYTVDNFLQKFLSDDQIFKLFERFENQSSVLYKFIDVPVVLSELAKGFDRISNYYLRKRKMCEALISIH